MATYTAESCDAHQAWYLIADILRDWSGNLEFDITQLA